MWRDVVGIAGWMCGKETRLFSTWESSSVASNCKRTGACGVSWLCFLGMLPRVWGETQQAETKRNTHTNVLTVFGVLFLMKHIYCIRTAYIWLI